MSARSSAYHYGGEEALKFKPVPDSPPKLKGEQMEHLARVVREENPQQPKSRTSGRGRPHHPG